MVKRSGVLAVLVVLGLALVNAQEVQTCEAGFRLFDHEFLEGEPVCVPENPQRVVALGIGAAEAVLFADKTLVGMSDWAIEELTTQIPEFENAFDGVVGLGREASLEQLLLLEPDLILMDASYGIDLQAASEIAPLVIAEEVAKPSWDYYLSLHSSALGAERDYNELEANYDARIAELQEALGDDRAQSEVSLVSARAGGITLWLVDTAVGGLIEDVGLGRPASQDYTGEAATAEYEDAPYANISEERLDLADGDEIFVFRYFTSDPAQLEEENTATEAFKQNPLWQQLGGVEAGNAYFVGEHWYRAQSYFLANKVIDDLFEHLVGRPGETAGLSIEEISQ